MPEEGSRSFVERILYSLFERLFGGIQKQIQKQIEMYIRKLAMVLGLVMVGLAFVTAGLIIIVRGAIAYLAQFMASWLAWGLVGLIVVLIGIIALIAGFMRLRRH